MIEKNGRKKKEKETKSSLRTKINERISGLQRVQGTLMQREERSEKRKGLLEYWGRISRQKLGKENGGKGVGRLQRREPGRKD